MKRLLVILLPLLVLLAPAPIRGQDASRAGVVVKFSDGSVHTSCVRFGEASISGLELLQRSGLDVIAQTSGNNAAVCKIGPDGCSYPAESCLACRFGAGQRGEYWAYWQLADGAWRYSLLGAGARRVRDGDVDGWAYGAGNVQTGAQPPVITFDQICPAKPLIAPTVVPVPTAEPVPSPTPSPAPPTPKPTIRPTPQPTARPTARPTQALALAPTATALPAASPSPPTATSVPATSVAAPTAPPVPVTAMAAPTMTPVPTRTGAPTASPEPTPVVTTPSEAAPTSPAAGAASELAGGPTSVNYVFFGMLLALIGGGVVLALRRRR